MKFEDVKMLIKAGYTKEEIQAMEHPEPTPAPEPAPEPKEPAPEPAPEPAEPVPTLENGQPMDQILQMLQGMIQQNQQTLQAMQAANIQAARMPAETKETPEDLIAKIIAPGPKAEKGGK
jgi:hypothetical protein